MEGSQYGRLESIECGRVELNAGDTNMRNDMLAKSLYMLFGVLYLVAGTTVLLFRTELLPPAVKSTLLEAAGGDLNIVHIAQEFGSLLVFTGLITLWFARHVQQSLFFHWAMTTFWALFALIHWFDVRGPVRFDVGVLINAIPFLVFLSVGLIARSRKAGP
jgi:hypothetical protein